MNYPTALIVALAIDEFHGSECEIRDYSGRGMYGANTLGVVSDCKPQTVSNAVMNYLFGKSLHDLANEVQCLSHAFRVNSDLPEIKCFDGLELEDIEVALEAVDFSCLRSDSMGHGYIIY